MIVKELIQNDKAFMKLLTEKYPQEKRKVKINVEENNNHDGVTSYYARLWINGLLMGVTR